MKNQTFGIEIETTGRRGRAVKRVEAPPTSSGNACVDGGESDIEMVQEVVRAIREAGARTDSSCGIHVHVGFGEHTPASLRRLVNIVNAKEDLLTMALGISQHRREEWCRPVDQRFLEALNRQKPDTLESFAAIWYRHNSEAGYYWEMLARHHYDHSFSYLPGACLT